MRTRAKKLAALGLAAVMAFSLAACGSGDSGSSGNSGGDANSGDSGDSGSDANSGDSGDSESAGGELSVSIWDTNQEPGLNEIMKDFTAETGIKVKLSVVAWDQYWTMLEAGAQGGSLPDVFWMHSNEAERYMSNDMLLDLTDKIRSEERRVGKEC